MTDQNEQGYRSRQQRPTGEVAQRGDTASPEPVAPQIQAIERRKADIARVAMTVKGAVRDFDRLLPEHIGTASFLSAASAALWKSEDLMSGAINDPEAFMVALRESASLGHLPGTDHYWLTPRKRGQRMSVLGIEGYQGIVERMYRSGGVLSVHAEIVRANDTFEPYAGPNGRPLHQFGGKLGAFSTRADRGEVIGTYAYAMLPGGYPSQAILLSIEDLMELKAASDSATSKWSPWNKWPLRMYLKSALRRLEPYVPVSAGYRTASVQAQAFIAASAPAVMPPRMEDDVQAEPQPDGDTIEGTVEDNPDRPVTDVPYDPEQWGGDPAWESLSKTRPQPQQQAGDGWEGIPVAQPGQGGPVHDA